MKKQNDFKSAISLTEDARLNALRAKRDAGDPHNPFCAKSGREAEYYKATQSVQACDLIRKVLGGAGDKGVRNRLQLSVL